MSIWITAKLKTFYSSVCTFFIPSMNFLMILALHCTLGWMFFKKIINIKKSHIFYTKKALKFAHSRLNVESTASSSLKYEFFNIFCHRHCSPHVPNHNFTHICHVLSDLLLKISILEGWVHERVMISKCSLFLGI